MHPLTVICTLFLAMALVADTSIARSEQSERPASVTGRETAPACFASKDRKAYACLEIVEQPGGEGGIYSFTNLNVYATDGKSYELARLDVENRLTLARDEIRAANAYLKQHGFTQGVPATSKLVGPNLHVLWKGGQASLKPPAIEIESEFRQCCPTWDADIAFAWSDGFVLSGVTAACNWDAPSGPCHWELTDPPIPPPSPSAWVTGKGSVVAELPSKGFVDASCSFASADRSTFACLAYTPDEMGRGHKQIIFHPSGPGGAARAKTVGTKSDDKISWDRKAIAEVNKELAAGGYTVGLPDKTADLQIAISGRRVTVENDRGRFERTIPVDVEYEKCCPTWSDADVVYFPFDDFVTVHVTAQCTWQSEDDTRACFMMGSDEVVEAWVAGNLETRRVTPPSPE